jgi:hypothetical protein
MAVILIVVHVRCFTPIGTSLKHLHRSFTLAMYMLAHGYSYNSASLLSFFLHSILSISSICTFIVLFHHAEGLFVQMCFSLV